jgi:hypothetical protein
MKPYNVLLSLCACVYVCALTEKGVRFWRTRTPVHPIPLAPAFDTFHLWAQNAWQTSTFTVNQCVYSVPWSQPVVTITPTCALSIPVCSPDHTIEIQLHSVDVEYTLWSFQWDNITSVGLRVIGGLWISFGDDVYIMEDIGVSWASVRISWTQTHMAISHASDRTVMHIPWPFRSLREPSFIQCSIGPGDPGVRIKAIRWDEVNVVTGSQLLALSPNPAACALSPSHFQFEGKQWRVNMDGATLSLDRKDLWRCREKTQATPWHTDSGEILIRYRSNTSLLPTKLTYTLQGSVSEARFVGSSQLTQPTLFINGEPIP